jgi:hypothetical protein
MLASDKHSSLLGWNVKSILKSFIDLNAVYLVVKMHVCLLWKEEVTEDLPHLASAINIRRNKKIDQRSSLLWLNIKYEEP